MDLTHHTNIVTIAEKKDEKFLRTKTQNFDFAQYKPKEIIELVAHMKRAMRRANGIGLSANQIGLPWRIFVAEIHDATGGTKFYAVFNPTIERTSKEVMTMEEGCLSVPKLFGPVERPKEIVVKCQNKQGKPLKIKAWGMLARIFQHEIDHLNGALFIDKSKGTHAPHTS